MRLLICTLAVVANIAFSAPGLPDSVSTLVRNGQFTRATQALHALLESPGLSHDDSAAAAFEIERLARINKDFTLSFDAVVQQLQPWYGDSARFIASRFSEDGSLEMMTIDGASRYFKQAVPNLFRINASARRLKTEKSGSRPDSLSRFLRKEIPRERAALGRGKSPAVRIRYHYVLTVHADAVPAGEIVRCWLPFPRTDVPRQTGVRLLGTSSAALRSQQFDPESHSSVYLEQAAQAGMPTKFWVDAEYSSHAENASSALTHNALGRDAGDPPGMYAGERPPHIRFTPGIRDLSAGIVGGERNKWKIVRKIYEWISDSIPWASAREYSTIPGIAEYCLRQRHGDCGIQTMLFMTLCRLNGIPAHWQSGWMMHPGNVDMHDWCEISLDNAHWIPVDQSFGLQRWAKDDGDRWFYLGGIDAYRLILNNDFSAPLYPPKRYPRSETVDFQRGEVEWRGGNLYFDQWDYAIDVTYQQ